MQQLFVNTLLAASVLALVAAGFGIIYSTARFFYFTHGAVYAVGAYSTYLLVIILHLPPALGILGGVAIAVLLGGLMARFIYGPLRRARADSLVLLLTSLGLFIVIQNVISLLFGDQTYSLSRGPVREGVSFLGGRITEIQAAIAIASLALVTILLLLFKFSTYGKKLRAVASDLELAQVVGIRSNRIIFLSFLVSSGLAGLAGIFSAYDTGLTPNMGLRILLLAVAASVVGGIRSVTGTLLGSLLIAFAQNFGIIWLPSQWQDAIVFLILILFLVLRPQGFFGKPLSKEAI